MAIAIIQLPTDGTGKMIAARSYTENANTVYAQAGYLTTDTAAGNPAAVTNAAYAGTEYALVTRPIRQGGGVLIGSGTASAIGTGNLLASTDVSMYSAISIHITGSNNGVQWFASNDNSNWSAFALNYNKSVSGGGTLTNQSDTGIFAGNVVGRYLRVDMTGFTSGSTTVTIYGFYFPQGVTNGVYASQGSGVGGWGAWAARITDNNATVVSAVQNTIPVGTEYGLVTRSIISGSQPASAYTASWTSATALNTALSVNILGYNTVSVAMSNTSTMTAGALTFEVSPDNTNWFPVAMQRIDGSYITENNYTLNQVQSRAWSTSVDGFNYFRVRLSTTITGTGTANIFIIPQTFAIEPIVTAGLQSPLKLTYHAANPTIATGTLTASTAKALLSFEHAATSTKTMKLQKLLVAGYCTTAVIGNLDLRITKGTAASTGGTAVTPGPASAADAAADTVVKSLPTITAATVIDTMPLTALAAATATAFNTTVVYDYTTASERKPLLLRAGVLESIVVNAFSNAAQAWNLTISAIFTEE